MTHPARTLRDRMPVAFTAHSVETSYMKRHICKFVLERDVVPINPFMGFEYFLSDTVDRDLVRRGNNTYAHVCDELWTFGTISDGVLEEIRLARELGKPMRHFSLGKDLASIREIRGSELQYEDGVERIETL